MIQQDNYAIIIRLLKISIIVFILLFISFFLIYDTVAKADTKSYEGEYCNPRRECAEGLVCDGNADHPDSDGLCVRRYRDVCIEVEQAAYDIRTKRCKVFSTPCHIPPGWQEVNSCKQDCFAINQPAFDPDTGECQVFENTCDVPHNWEKIPSCEEACLDIRQHAFDQKTGACREFTSQCDIPDDWIFVKSCDRDYLRVCGGPDYIPCRYGERCVIDEELEEWYKIYAEEVDFDSPPLSLVGIISQYGFYRNNAEDYSVMKEYTASEFWEDYFITDNAQYTIDGHYSVSEFENIYVKYEFPGFLLANNKYDLSERTGSAFNFYYKYFYKDSYHDLDYEIYSIDAVVIR